MSYPRVASFKTHADFTAHLESLGLELPCDQELEAGAAATLAAPLEVSGRRVGNRFCILPMEGWDGTTDGRPTDLTRRRWRNFGISGAKLIWGGEAIAVRHDGRANPNQLMINESTLRDLESMRVELVEAHQQRFSDTEDLLVGLQLTHSGRFARPNDKSRLEPRTLQHNPALDPRFGNTDDSALLSDDDLSTLVEDFVAAAGRAAKAGFAFVDIKHCHGYLGHELLSSYDRPGRYGGSFENRAEAPTLGLAVRVSVFDFVPFHPGPDKTGIPDRQADPRLAFGGDGSGQGIDLSEPSKLMELFNELEIELACSTCGSPYYNPHIQRPAYFPPSDGYAPPEDPLVGVARQITATAELKQRHPELVFVGSGYSYLQDWLPHVARAVLRRGWVDSIGLGRMVLSYPELPADVLAGRELQRKKVCRTFSDCTTAPRNGMVSGCYPLDPFYKSRPEREALKALPAK